MVRTGIIKELFAERTGVNKKTNESWLFTPILFEWEEDVNKVEREVHSVVIDIKGKKNTERIKLAIETKECVPVSMYFNANSYTKSGETEAKGFNSVRGYLSRDFDLTF